MDRVNVERLESLLDAAARVRALVVGDVMLDIYLRGAASRISPEAPVPVVHIREEWHALGGAANVAANIVALGARCVLCGTVGADDAGRRLRDAAREAGIDDAGLVEIRGRPTTVKTRIVAHHHQVARFDREVDDDLDDEAASRLVERLGQLAPDVDVLILEDYNKGVLTRAVIEGAIAAGRANGLPVVVDPKSRFFFDYAGATVFKPNLVELEAALRERARPDDAAWMDQTRRRLGCEHLLLTLGEHGMALMTAAGVHLRVPTVARSVFDVSGAGDTVTGTVAVALAAGGTPEEAAVLANHAAGLEVGKLGVATVSADELRAALPRGTTGTIGA